MSTTVIKCRHMIIQMHTTHTKSCMFRISMGKLTWIEAIWGWFPLLTNGSFAVRSWWNLHRYLRLAEAVSSQVSTRPRDALCPPNLRSAPPDNDRPPKHVDFSAGDRKVNIAMVCHCSMVDYYGLLWITMDFSWFLSQSPSQVLSEAMLTRNDVLGALRCSWDKASITKFLKADFCVMPNRTLCII